MKKSLKTISTHLSIFFIVAAYSLCNAQHEAFEFEFGTSTTLENSLSGNTDNDSTLKWINVNTVKKGWTVNDDGVLVNLGLPIGVVRSEKQYENFILHVEWMHMEAGGNSGVFAWSGANPPADSPLPDGVEIQMLELDWVNINAKNGVQQPIAYVHGEVWGVGGVVTDPDNPRGERSKSIENRAKGKGVWNTYDVVAVDGVIKLSVNGKFVNGISKSTQKKGYFCLESEGAEIHFRNFKIIELPPGVTSEEQTAPKL
ncbi:protein of unknown function [Pricia antarctica]|uniref:3-keto-alpha-glucoside-1,2-lyase/3-keto-2-hydroxy-glucal hydratase domain-containing protein n=1 Tax=Pricia antarctica TaxID=641691 RepID=A0A1G6WQM7_9FLAO|nr:DUF1080 domain-containing protein [Pricia antarctica]SDD68094.1 protein of unknown function [Pricia antarctica]